MAREAFLINPPKRIGLSARRFKLHNNSKRRRMVKKLWDNSWSEAIPAQRHSLAAVKGWKSIGVAAKSRVRSRSKSIVKSNPFGEELMLIGGNPPMKRHRRKHSKKKGFFSFLDNPRRSHRLRHNRKRKHNPIHRRRHRRNPEAVAGSSALSLKNPMSFAMPALIGVGGAVAAAYIPSKLLSMSATNTDGSTNYTTLLVKAGIGVGGAMVLKGTNRIAWVAGVAASMLAPILETSLGLTTTSTTKAGLGAFLPAGSFSIPQIAPKQQPAQYGAFPNEFSAYPSESITPY